MMILAFIEQSVFLGTLSALVLALLWPHVRPRAVPLMRTIFSNFLTTIFPSIQYATLIKETKISAKPEYVHPKLLGLTLVRKPKDKLGIFGLGTEQESQLPTITSINENPSFINGHRPNTFGGGTQRTSTTPAANQSSMLLTIFTSCLIALIIYTLMKMIKARFGEKASGTRGSRGRGKRSKVAFDRGRPNMTTRDRDKRVNQLIKQYGSRNVSTAVKYLVVELEKQKQLLYESYQFPESNMDSNKPKENCPVCFNDDGLPNVDPTIEQEDILEAPEEIDKDMDGKDTKMKFTE